MRSLSKQKENLERLTERIRCENWTINEIASLIGPKFIPNQEYHIVEK